MKRILPEDDEYMREPIRKIFKEIESLNKKIEALTLENKIPYSKLEEKSVKIDSTQKSKKKGATDEEKEQAVLLP